MVYPRPEPLPDGRVFGGRWRVVHCLRAGGMGTVYEVVHQETQARCALKVLSAELLNNSEMRGRFRQEAMVTAAIESDHIVKVFDGGTDAETGAPFLVMELLRGEDLAARVARGPVPADEAVLLLAQAALGLARTHAAGVVHRDLKPANMFVTRRDDDSVCLKVLDFGIAKVIASASQAETTRAVGTPLYMAPEQVKGDRSIGPPADLYGLAQIAYTLLVGAPYWAEEHGEHKNVYPLLMAITEGTREPASLRAARSGVTLPPAFDAWFERATATDPSARFGGVEAMVEELAIALSTPAPSMRARPAPRRISAAPALTVPTDAGLARETALPVRRPRALAVGATVAAFAALAVFVYSPYSPRPPRTPELSASRAAATTGASAVTPALAPDRIEPPIRAAPRAEQTPSPAEVAPTSVAPSSAPISRLAPRAPQPTEPPRPAGSKPSSSAQPRSIARQEVDPSDAYRRDGTP